MVRPQRFAVMQVVEAEDEDEDEGVKAPASPPVHAQAGAGVLQREALLAVLARAHGRCQQVHCGRVHRVSCPDRRPPMADLIRPTRSSPPHFIPNPLKRRGAPLPGDMPPDL